MWEGETLQRSASVEYSVGQSGETFSLRIALGGLPGGASRFRRLGLDLDLTFAATAGLHFNPARLGSLRDREAQMQDPVGVRSPGRSPSPPCRPIATAA